MVSSDMTDELPSSAIPQFANATKALTDYTIEGGAICFVAPLITEDMLRRNTERFGVLTGVSRPTRDRPGSDAAKAVCTARFA